MLVTAIEVRVLTAGQTSGTGKRLRALSILLGDRGWRLMGLALGASLVRAVTENLIAVALGLLAYSVGILDAARRPHWLPHDLTGLGTGTVLGLLAILGLMRCVTEATGAGAAHAILEYVRLRLQRLQGYRMLMLPELPPLALSEAHLLMGDNLNKATSWCFFVGQIVTYAPIAASFFLALCWLAWKEAVLATVCLLPLGMIFRGLNRTIQDQAARIPGHRAILERALVRICRNRVLIRVMHLQAMELRRFNDAAAAYFRSSFRTFCLRDINAAMTSLFGVLIIVLMVGIDAAVFRSSPAILIGFVYLFLALVRRMADLVDNAGGLMQTQAQFDTAADLVLSVDEDHRQAAFRRTATGLRESGNPPRPSLPPPAITLRGVRFRWPGARKPVFEGLDLHIPAGSRFGIVGRNGSGKTTLLHLVLGLEQPEAGEVSVGGIPARDYTPAGGRVSYVGAENLLIFGTVRENLLYGVCGHLEDAVLRQALDQVGLGPWLDGLDHGLDHILGETEEGLSAGQKQRLSLARALLRKPSLLVLDEASANVDTSAELEVVSLLDTIATTCTILIVSHKPGILSGVSHRLELRDPYHDERA